MRFGRLKNQSSHLICGLIFLIFICLSINIKSSLNITVTNPSLDVFNISTAVHQQAYAGVAKAVQGKIAVKNAGSGRVCMHRMRSNKVYCKEIFSQSCLKSPKTML